MKRLIVILLLASMMASSLEWSTVLAVEVETCDATKTAQEISIGEYINFGKLFGEDITWQVIGIENGKLLLFSSKTLFNGQYDASLNKYLTNNVTTYYWYGSNSWRSSDIRTFLNSESAKVQYDNEIFDYSDLWHGIASRYYGENTAPNYASIPGFLNSQNFSKQELYILCPITHTALIDYTDPLADDSIIFPTVSAMFNTWERVKLNYPLFQSAESTDRVFLLSAKEVQEYLVEQGLNFDAENIGNVSHYWLRDCIALSTSNYNAYHGMYSLSINHSSLSYAEADTLGGIRPACWIKPIEGHPVGGSGTVEDPYTLSDWEPKVRNISALAKEIDVNESGNAWAYFQLTDFFGEIQVGCPVTYTIQMREYHSVTDGNGIFSVQLPTATGDYSLEISVDGFSGIINGAIQTVSVTRKDLSYSQKWEASLGAELGASIGPSVSASVGVAEFEAAAAKAAANAGIGSTFSIENSYENGVRTLELTTQYDVSAGVEFKSGVEATAPSVTIKPVTLSAGASYMEQTSAGLKIQNYDPHNMDHLIKAGSFYLQTALLGMHSVWAQRFLDLLDIKAHNQSAYTNKITLEAGASLGALESGGESITVAGADAKLSIAAEQSTDYLEKTRSNALDLKTELGCGLLKVPSAAVSGYAIGLGGTNSLKAAVTYASDQTAQELSYTYYEAGEQDIAWLEAVEESKTKLSYKEEQLDKIAEAHPVLGSLLAQRRLIIPPIELIPALQSISMDDIIGEVEHIDVEKTGASFSIPFGIDLGVGASIKLKGTFVEELSYTRSTGVVTSGTEYITSESDDHSAELWAQKQSLDELVTEPVRAAFDELASLFTDVRDYIVNGVKNGLATITGKVSKWFVNVTRIIAGETQSYSILTLQSEDEPDSNAAVAVTVGEPYQVAIYTDETQEALVPDDELGDNSVILTMNYTPELLEEAGASADAVLQIYRFVPERNSYVLVPGCVLNKKEMKVMVKILHQGEYILATDSASPLISDFALSDQTPTPTLTVLASDMSGFKEFRFWVDDGEDLVTIDNMDEYYDASTGMFTYRFTEALTGGTHTAYFQAMDKLENANQEPFAFTFTIDAAPPEITTVTVPEGTVTDAQGFQVTAQASDDAMLSQVMLNAELPDGKTLHLTMEEQENGRFAATVAPLSGAGTVTLQVVAVDQAGNRTQSADYAVPISILAEKTGLYLEANRTGTVLEVTVHNAQPKALGAWLVAAAYDARGAMVDLQSSYVGLTGNTSKTYNLSFACGAEKIASVTAFLVDVSNGYVPLTAERIS